MARSQGFYKRNDIWWVSTDPLTGKRHSTGRRTLSEAREWRDARRKVAADPTIQASLAISLSDCLESFLDFKAGRIAAGTMDYYTRKGAALVDVLGENTSLVSITPGAVDAYAQARRSHGVSDNTVSAEVALLIQALKLAKRRGEYPHDVSVIRPTDLHHSVVSGERALTLDELVRLSEKLSRPRARAVWAAAGLGLRPSELFGLRRSDVQKDGMVRVRGTKTDESDRLVPKLSVFEPHLSTALKGKLPFTAWVNSSRDLARAAARCKPKMDPLTLRDLRRSFATILLELGVDRDVVRRMLGHTTGRMLELHYGKPKPEALRGLAEERLAVSHHHKSITLAPAVEAPTAGKNRGKKAK